jgi:hypothetical protein
VADVQRLAVLLADIPVMKADESRERVVGALRPAISGTIPRHAALLMDVYSIVQTCRDYPGGPTELMSVIRGFSGDSVSFRAAFDLLCEMGLDEA